MSRQEMIADYLAPADRPLSDEASEVADLLLDALALAEDLPAGDRLELLLQVQRQVSGAIARAGRELADR